MKMIIVALALVAVALAAELPPAQVLRSSFDQQPNGGYNFNFEIDDGTQRQEEGQLKEVLDEDNKPQQVVVVRGSYTYKNDQGNVDTVNYFADETGYHAEGPSIPKNPTPTRR